MRRHVLAVLAFAAATFATQATSHFAVNAAHYAAVPHIRAATIFPLGLLAMLVQGAVLSYLYARLARPGATVVDALRFAWLAGAFLVSYIAFAEAAKYSVPAVGPWIAVELGAGAVQFTLYGLLLGLVHRAGAAGAVPARP